MTSSRGLELIEQLRDLKRQVRLLEADIAGVLVEMDREDIAKDAGYSTLPALVAQALRVDPRKASRMVATGHLVAEELTPTGHLTPAPLPSMRQALLAGLIDGEHIHAVAEAITALPEWTSLQQRELVETTLATTARCDSPWVVRKHGQILVERINQDGTVPNSEERQAEPINTLVFKRTADGRIQFRGDLEPEIAEVFETLLTDYGTPQPLAEGIPDPRSKRQRYGDAFSDIVDLAATPATDGAGGGGGARPRLILTLDLNTLIDAVGTATLESGTALCPSAARRLACDAELIPMVLNGQSVPLDRGRSTRLATPAQRDALMVRDKGCAMPGCPLPVRLCDAHHVQSWLDGGATDVANLILLCRRHHRLLHHADWEITLHHGVPEFIPPTWVDPQQRPMRNILRI